MGMVCFTSLFPLKAASSGGPHGAVATVLITRQQVQFQLLEEPEVSSGSLASEASSTTLEPDLTSRLSPPFILTSSSDVKVRMLALLVNTPDKGPLETYALDRFAVNSAVYVSPGSKKALPTKRFL